MSDIVIKVENLSKKYTLRHQQQERYTALRDVMTNGIKNLGKKVFSTKTSNLSPKTQTSEEFFALKDVCFEIKQGDRVGIIGRNGAGKTTLLKILSRITEPSSGRVAITGRVASLLEVGTGFHPELTGRENIFLNGAILGMTKVEIKRKFDEIVDFAEVERFLDTPVKHYSSGMYVRLAFAVAAHLEPEILIVDEVLAVGDAQFQKKCLGKMEEVGHEGRTVLLVSHNMTALQSLCNVALWLDSGCILRVGETKEVVAEYLQYGTADLLEQEWKDEATAPGNEKIRLHFIRLIPGTEAEINVATPLTIDLAFRSHLEERRLLVSMYVYNSEGICVFNTDSPAFCSRQGLIKVSCRLPGNFLNDGFYRLSISIIQEFSLLLFHLDEALFFEVRDIERSDGWFGKWPGIVRPKLDWDVSNVA